MISSLFDLLFLPFRLLFGLFGMIFSLIFGAFGIVGSIIGFFATVSTALMFFVLVYLLWRLFRGRR